MVESERLLIVSADDYGLSTSLSAAILRAGERGVVTSTSALAVAPAFDGMAPALRDAGIGVGAHLALVGEDPPLLSAREVPTLVGEDGSFRASWRQLVPDLVRKRVDPDDIRRELRAQLDALAQHGLDVTHVDSHQHTHLWPSVRDVVIELATERSIGAIRVPRSARLGVVGVTVRRCARRLESAATAAGLAWPEAFAGLDEAGGLGTPEMNRAIVRLAQTGARTAELGTHPGERYDVDLEPYRWGYRWADELHALLSVTVRHTIATHGLRTGTFADL